MTDLEEFEAATLEMFDPAKGETPRDRALLRFKRDFSLLAANAMCELIDGSSRVEIALFITETIGVWASHIKDDRVKAKFVAATALSIINHSREEAE